MVFVLQSLAWTWHGPSLPSEVDDELRRKESLGETDLGTSQTTLLAFSISCQGCGLAMSLPCRHLGGAHHLEGPGCLSGLGCPVWSPVAQAIGGGLSGGRWHGRALSCTPGKSGAGVGQELVPGYGYGPCPRETACWGAVNWATAPSAWPCHTGPACALPGCSTKRRGDGTHSSKRRRSCRSRPFLGDRFWLGFPPRGSEAGLHLPVEAVPAVPGFSSFPCSSPCSKNESIQGRKQVPVPFSQRKGEKTHK